MRFNTFKIIYARTNTVGRLPDKLKYIMLNYWPFSNEENRTIIANEIMQAMKIEQEKAFHAGIELEYTSGASMNFEQWHANAYLK